MTCITVLAGYNRALHPSVSGGKVVQTQKVYRFSEEGKAGDHNIALLKLQKPLFEGNKIKYANLPKQGLDYEGQLVYAVGHGIRNKDSKKTFKGIIFYRFKGVRFKLYTDLYVYS